MITTQRAIDSLLDSVDEMTRLGELTNEQLVREAMHCEAGDFDVVMEMASRLDPGWENRPQCECGKCQKELANLHDAHPNT